MRAVFLFTWMFWCNYSFWKTKDWKSISLKLDKFTSGLKIEVWIEIGITANKFLYENINAYDWYQNKMFCWLWKLQENTAKFNFEDNTLKLGKASLSNQQLKRISLMFATDLKNFAETFGNSQNLTAKEVYSHLQNNQ